MKTVDNFLSKMYIEGELISKSCSISLLFFYKLISLEIMEISLKYLMGFSLSMKDIPHNYTPEKKPQQQQQQPLKSKAYQINWLSSSCQVMNIRCRVGHPLHSHAMTWQEELSQLIW